MDRNGATPASIDRLNWHPFMFTTSNAIKGWPVLHILNLVQILHHHPIHGHIWPLDYPYVAAPVTLVSTSVWNHHQTFPSDAKKVAKARRIIKHFQFFFHTQTNHLVSWHFLHKTIWLNNPSTKLFDQASSSLQNHRIITNYLPTLLQTN